MNTQCPHVKSTIISFKHASALYRDLSVHFLAIQLKAVSSFRIIFNIFKPYKNQQQRTCLVLIIYVFLMSALFLICQCSYQYWIKSSHLKKWFKTAISVNLNFPPLFKGGWATSQRMWLIARSRTNLKILYKVLKYSFILPVYFNSIINNCWKSNED